MTGGDASLDALREALSADSASTRLRAALQAGSDGGAHLVGRLIERCAVETDFYVRDMLTWALTRCPTASTVPVLLAELRSPIAQARSQALHSLSKIQEPGTWPAVTAALLGDVDDEVARSAWRAAVVLVPQDQRAELAVALSSQFARGDRSLQLSLSRALIALGEAAIEPVLRRARASEDPAVRAHAAATERLLRDPDAAFELDLREAKRAFVLGRQR